MPCVARDLALAAIMCALAGVDIAACADIDHDAEPRATESRAPERSGRLPFRSEERPREEVLEGARRDFEVALQGPDDFESCFIARFRRELTRRELAGLI